MDDNLIEQTCNQTPYPDLCVDLINELINDEPGNIPAEDCRNSYNDVIQIALPQATEAFSKGDYKSVELGMVNIVANADSRETGLSGGSPFKDESKAVHDLAYVAAAIARVLRSLCILLLS
ncbi:hypothetical protein C1H46_034151 [Malus baccata]|uniref:Pectinesterase inhibitor domain-containing protein n=1 Tax=Malus baccata TaxID=106549 RepID=A0A540L184_MALBA|nr:hypothetical protein C1H46_034151 [Malus baccata]